MILSAHKIMILISKRLRRVLVFYMVIYPLHKNVYKTISLIQNCSFYVSLYNDREIFNQIDHIYQFDSKNV